MDDALLTANEVARLLAIQPSTVYAFAAKGTLPCVRLSKGRNRDLLRFRREDIEKLIREGIAPAGQETGAPGDDDAGCN